MVWESNPEWKQDLCEMCFLELARFALQNEDNPLTLQIAYSWRIFTDVDIWRTNASIGWKRNFLRPPQLIIGDPRDRKRLTFFSSAADRSKFVLVSQGVCNIDWFLIYIYFRHGHFEHTLQFNYYGRFFKKPWHFIKRLSVLQNEGCSTLPPCKNKWSSANHCGCRRNKKRSLCEKQWCGKVVEIDSSSRWKWRRCRYRRVVDETPKRFIKLDKKVRDTTLGKPYSAAAERGFSLLKYYFAERQYLAPDDFILASLIKQPFTLAVEK